MEETEDIRKRIKKQLENRIETDNSDIPIHEEFVSEKHIKELKKRKP